MYNKSRSYKQIEYYIFRIFFSSTGRTAIKTAPTSGHKLLIHFLLSCRKVKYQQQNRKQTVSTGTSPCPVGKANYPHNSKPRVPAGAWANWTLCTADGNAEGTAAGEHRGGSSKTKQSVTAGSSFPFWTRTPEDYKQGLKGVSVPCVHSSTLSAGTRWRLPRHPSTEQAVLQPRAGRGRGHLPQG